MNKVLLEEAPERRFFPKQGTCEGKKYLPGTCKVTGVYCGAFKREVPPVGRA